MKERNSEMEHNREKKGSTQRGKREAKKMNKNINKSPTSLSFPSISYINVMVPLPIQNPIGNLKKLGQNEIWLQYKNNTSHTQQPDKKHLLCAHGRACVSFF